MKKNVHFKCKLQLHPKLINTVDRIIIIVINKVCLQWNNNMSVISSTILKCLRVLFIYLFFSCKQVSDMFSAVEVFL